MPALHRRRGNRAQSSSGQCTQRPQYFPCIYVRLTVRIGCGKLTAVSGVFRRRSWPTLSINDALRPQTSMFAKRRTASSLSRGFSRLLRVYVASRTPTLKRTQRQVCCGQEDGEHHSVTRHRREPPWHVRAHGLHHSIRSRRGPVVAQRITRRVRGDDEISLERR